MTKVAAEALRPACGWLLGYSRRRTTRAVSLPAGPDRSGSWLCRPGIFLLPPPQACLTRMRTFLINVPRDQRFLPYLLDAELRCTLGEGGRRRAGDEQNRNARSRGAQPDGQLQPRYLGMWWSRIRPGRPRCAIFEECPRRGIGGELATRQFEQEPEASPVPPDRRRRSPRRHDDRSLNDRSHGQRVSSARPRGLPRTFRGAMGSLLEPRAAAAFG
jgi:hypothetical protein